MFSDVFFELVPIPFIISYLFAMHAYWDDSTECFYFRMCFLEFPVFPVKITAHICHFVGHGCHLLKDLLIREHEVPSDYKVLAIVNLYNFAFEGHRRRFRGLETQQY